jgi:NitT/TauT family transport system substrate-binding protein
MAKFIIQPHGRLQEWIADKGYFRDEGLDYEFQAGWAVQSRKLVDISGRLNEVRGGAFETYAHGGGNKGVKSDVSCACHWAIGQASAQQIGTMWRDSYVDHSDAPVIRCQAASQSSPSSTSPCKSL